MGGKCARNIWRQVRPPSFHFMICGDLAAPLHTCSIYDHLSRAQCTASGEETIHFIRRFCGDSDQLLSLRHEALLIDQALLLSAVDDQTSRRIPDFDGGCVVICLRPRRYYCCTPECLL